VLFALSVWRLSSGPVSLAFLAPYVEDALISENASYRLSFDDLVLTWTGWQNTLDIRAVGVRVLEHEGDVMAGVPEIGIELSLPAMARGLIAPTRLELFGPGLRLVRRDEGEYDLGFGDTIAAEQFSLAEELLRDLLLPPDPDRAMGYLERINVIDARLVVRDDVNGVEWVAPSARIAIERHEKGIRAVAVVRLDVAGTTIDLTSTVVYDANSRLIDLGLEFTDISPPTIAAMLPAYPELADLDLPLSGRLDLLADLGGHVLEVGFDISGGAGTIPALPIYLDAAPFEVSLIKARGRLDDGLTRLVLEEFFADFGGPNVTLVGSFSGDMAVPETNANLVVRGAPAHLVERYWPPEVTPEARAWVVAHVPEGLIEELTIRMVLDAEDWAREQIDRDRIQGTFRVSNATVYYQDFLPPAVGVTALGRFDPKEMHIDAAGGNSGPLALKVGTVDLHDMDSGAGWAEVVVSVAGPLGATLEVLNRPELGYAEAIGLDPAVIEGNIEGELAISVPLREGIGLDEIEIEVGADLSDVAVAVGGLGSLIGDHRIDRGNASVLLDQRGFDLTGEARVGGIPMKIFWREEFDSVEGRLAGRRLDAIARLDETARAKLGFSHPWVGGSIDVELRLMELGAGSASIAIDVDAEDATLMAPALDWHKAAGEAANARIMLDMVDGEIARVSQFGLLARDLSTAGVAERNAAGHWMITFDRLQSALNDVSGQVVMHEDGGLAVAVEGSSLDLRPYFDRDRADDTSGRASTPISLTARVDVVLLAEDIVLQGVDAQVVYDGTLVRQATVAGVLEGADEMILRLDNGARVDTRVLTLASNNAGGVLSALDVTDHMVGGTLRLDAVIDDGLPGHPVVGRFTVEDFHIVDAPALAKLLNVFTLTGAIEMLQGKGMPFGRFDAPFTYIDGILELDGARATSLSMGLTMNGAIDIDNDMVDIEGTIVPAYLLNTALSGIPVIGDILTGPDGEGVFAATYQMEGARTDPDVFVNPLAALAPGILRELFTGGDRASTIVRSDSTGRVTGGRKSTE
jgi:hypothetical protein